jgi:hypothetical protein
MASTIRTHVAAAALLLLPMASTLLAAPAAAQQRAVVAQPDIRSLTLNSNAGLAPGAVLRVQLAATPGARKPGVTLGGSGVHVALRERAAGNYVGSYTVRRGDRIDPLQRLTARASYGSRTLAQSFSYPTAFQALALGNAGAPRGEAGDQRPPRVTGLSPANGARVDERGRTTIFGRLDDDRSGIDPASVRLRVDGLDVTRDARITRDDILYRERLGSGRHSAELVVRDRAGNASRTAWTFEVL